MSRPKSAEFSDYTKRKALERDNHTCAICEYGDDPQDPWTFHHIIFLDWGIQHGIPHSVLSHLANCQPLHRSCHEHLHNEYDEPLTDEVQFVLSQLGIQLGLWAKAG